MQALKCILITILAIVLLVIVTVLAVSGFPEFALGLLIFGGILVGIVSTLIADTI